MRGHQSSVQRTSDLEGSESARARARGSRRPGASFAKVKGNAKVWAGWILTWGPEWPPRGKQVDNGIEDAEQNGEPVCSSELRKSAPSVRRRGMPPRKILEWLDSMDPDRRHRDFITKELRWSVTGPDRIADMDYSVHKALLDLLERSDSATTKRPRAS